ncbi:hypothetical protein ACFQMA_25470 [Halosimplex aquaticum]|uniref:DUF8076 domain-containing protein n=1 Tax=Halosimplex aquaticum TaxID=3026162 RepID=A0ABD5Y8D8_9EURY
MSDIDAVAGMYNIIVSGERESADYRVPVDEFLSKLENRDLPDEICVVGLEDVLTDEDDIRDRLVSTMRKEMDYLNSQRPLPTIQFVVEGTFRVLAIPSKLKLTMSSTLCARSLADRSRNETRVGLLLHSGYNRF